MPRRLIRLAAALLVAAAVWAGRTGLGRGGGPPPVTARPAAPAATAPHPEIGFRDAQLLDAHFRKHGAEFGVADPADYLRLAQRLRDAPAGGEILETTRGDGVVTRFDRRSGAFLAFDRDLTIRTFFRPNDGERYYSRQRARGSNLP